MTARPEVEVVDAVAVRIHIPQPNFPRVDDDDGTAHAFLAWTLEAKTFPLAGTSSSGPGFYAGVFAAEHAEAIRRWFAERGFPA